VSRLQNGDLFPSLSVPAVGGGTISLPEDLAGGFGIVLLYRGSWCPYCNRMPTFG
jgi:peroxiredoxin